MSTGYVQDVPPKGGYPKFTWKRSLPQRGPSSQMIFVGTALVMGYGWYKLIKANREWNETHQERVLQRTEELIFEGMALPVSRSEAQRVAQELNPSIPIREETYEERIARKKEHVQGFAKRFFDRYYPTMKSVKDEQKANALAQGTQEREA